VRCQIEQHALPLKQKGARSRWQAGKTMRAAGLAAALAAGVLAAAAASALPASAAVIASFSAKSGEFRGGRLILPGVSGRVRYLTDTGRSRTMSLGWLHRRVFLPGKPPTGMLHISGRSDDPTFTLSNPRYNASRQTVSYNAKPLPGTPLSRRGPRRAPLRFGDASLTILPHPALAVGDNGGHNCQMIVQNTPGATAENLALQSSFQWNTDNWVSAPAGQILMDTSAYIESDGGLWRGCAFSAVYAASGVTITVAMSWPWNAGLTTSCTSSDTTQLVCQRDDTNVVGWDIDPAGE
jgi:hypothetical protein